MSDTEGDPVTAPADADADSTPAPVLASDDPEVKPEPAADSDLDSASASDSDDEDGDFALKEDAGAGDDGDGDGTDDDEDVDDADEDEDEDEEDDEDDEDEDEDEDEPRSRKRRRKETSGREDPNIARFLDIEAGVAGGRGDDDDEEDYDPTDREAQVEAAEAVEAEAEALEHHRRRRERELRMEGMDAEEIVKDLEERYDQDAYLSDDEYVAEDRVLGGDASVTRELHQPTINDKKLFLVKCRPGSERELVLSLLNKYFDLKGSSEPLRITSAIASDSLTGIVYVEAQNETQALAGVKDMRLAFGGWSCKLVPLNEMVAVLSVTHKGVTLKPGSWIRVRRGAFKGDLGKIESVDQREHKMMVQLVPRIDYKRLPTHPSRLEKAADDEDRDDDDEDEAGGAGAGAGAGAGGKRRRRRQTSRMRPPQGVFDADDIKKYGGVIQEKRDLSGEIVYHFEGDRYKQGYVYKKLSTKGVDGSVVTPNVDEFQRFQEVGKGRGDEDKAEGDGDGDDEMADEPPMSSTGLTSEMKRKALFSKGDRVKVIEGALKNLLGVVESVNTEFEEVVIIPEHKDLRDPLTFKPNQLQKHFNVGSHVKVVGGRHEGETGLVLRVTDECIVIFTDVGQDELKVLGEHVQEASEVNSGLDMAGNYAVHDLVQIDALTVGMIVRVDRDVFTLLDQTGQKHTRKLTQMGRRRGSRYVQGLDCESRTISMGDAVTMDSDTSNERSGIIKALFRTTAWVHDKTAIENTGIVVVPTRSLRAKTVGLADILSQRDPYGMAPPSPANAMGASGAMGVAGGGKAVFNRYKRPGQRKLGPSTDSMVGMDVTVPSGPFKGYLGVVKEVMDDVRVRVELHANARLVVVEKSKLGATGTQGLLAVGATSGGGLADYGMAPATPAAHYFGEARTPMWGDSSATPMRDPGTPGRAWDPNTPATPAPHYGRTEESRDAWDANQPAGTPAPTSGPPTHTHTPYDGMGMGMGTGMGMDPHAHPGQGQPGALGQPVPGSGPLPDQIGGDQWGYGADYGAGAGAGAGVGGPDIDVGMHTGMPPPAVPGADAYPEEEEEEPWYDRDVAVVLEGREGVIQEVNEDGSCEVFMLDTRELEPVPVEDLYLMTRAQISKKDRVKVVLGTESRGQFGFVVSIEGSGDVLVNFGGNSIKILHVHSLAKVLPGVAGTGVVLVEK